MGERQRAAVPSSAQRNTATAAREALSTGHVRANRHEADGPVLRQMMATRALQPRLTVGPADDPYEREAERTADVVMSPDMSAPIAGPAIPRHGIAASLSRVVRRALGKTDAPTTKDDDWKRKKDEEKRKEDEKKTVVQKKSAGPGPSVVPSGVEQTIETLTAGGGSPLPESLRARFEPRFGYDFGAVRVHTNEKATGAATALGARAFTVGDHLFFGDGEYQPTSAQGQRLIAHELTHVVQQGADPGRVRRRPIVSWQVGGTTFFKARSGDVIELPDDMTAEQVAKLEDEAIAAERRLAELPKPKPVPEVHKPAPKPEKTPPPKPKARAKRRGGKAPPKAAEATAALMKAVGGGKVAQYLATKGGPVFAKGAAKLATLRGHEQTHDDAGEKLKKTEDAVVIPTSEEQAAGNAGQVDVVGGRTSPVIDENKGKKTLAESLAANVPKSIGVLDNFQRDKKAQHTGAEVLAVVQVDKNAVVGTFGDVKLTPPPVPSGHEPVQLPPAEGAPPTPTMALGRGAIAPLLKEHTDVSEYTKQADAKLTEEGVTQEQLDMVDSGDLAEANKEKKGMKKFAATEPVAVQKMANEERTKVDKELAHEEHSERGVLAARRKSALHATGGKQKDTKTALEKKREDVAKDINDRYKQVQDKVTKRLADLETESMKRFDDGNAEAARVFEADVKRELDAYKDDRYSGWFGWARKAKDWLLGMDDLPRVKAIFETNRDAFVKRIEKLVADIAADNARVIKECHEELTTSKEKIEEYVASLEPALQDIGKKAAAEMNDKLAELDKTISRKEEELKEKLKDKQTAAIKAIDEKIEKMKEAMSGALAKVGRLLLAAAKKFFTWALEKFGFSLSTIENIINKGVAVLKAIFRHPIQFVKNLIGSAKSGFLSFAKHFVTHLKDAVFEWLTGSLEGISLPDSWTLKGIVGVLFQLVGITWANIKKALVKLIPEPVVEGLKTTFGLVKTLFSDGPMAAWEQIKEMGEELKQSFVASITDWIKWKVVEESVKTIVAMFIPGAGIIKAIIAIYDTIVFFIQKARDIMEMIGSFLGSIAEIAAGNIGAAAQALENGLARGLKLVISFLAKFLHLDGITARIRQVLDTIRGKVDAVIDKVAAWVVKQAKGVIGSVKTAAGKLFEWWKARKKFRSADGEDHQVGFEGEDESAELVVYSTPQRMAAYFKTWSTGIGAIADATAKAQQEKALDDAKAKYAVVKALQNELSTRAVKGADDSVRQKKADQLTTELAALAQLLALHDLGPATPRPPAVFPPFANGVLASSFKASYLTRSVVGTGTEPTEASQPKSWDVVRANKLSDRAGWVRMHLLTAQLGGLAKDSNLVPARGTQTNFVFRDAVEHPARDALLGKGSKPESMIWYEVNVKFHAATATHGPGFPSFIEISWGGYEPKNGKWKEKTRSGTLPQSPQLPDLSAAVGLLHINLEGRARVGSVFGITELYSRRIVEMVTAKGPFKDADDLIARVKAYNPNLASVIASKAQDPKVVSYSLNP